MKSTGLNRAPILVSFGHAAGIIRRITQSWLTFTDFAHFTD